MSDETDANVPRLAGEPHASGPFLSRGVASVGLASFFSDTGHEITTAMLASFVTGTLRG